MQRNEALVGNSLRTSDPNIKVRLVPGADPDCGSPDDCGLKKRVSLAANFGDVAFSDFSGDTPLTLPLVDGAYQIYVEMRDPAGNIASAVVGVDLLIILDQRGPEVPGLRRHYISDRKIRLEISPPADPHLAYFLLERNVPARDGASWHSIRVSPAVADDLGPLQNLTVCDLQTKDCQGPTDCLLPVNDSGGTLLVEDRDVVTGSSHYYRVRAVDDLGNASATSVPLDAGTPLGTPEFTLIRQGENRSLLWRLAEGTLFVDRTARQLLDGIGEIFDEEEVTAASGHYDLPKLDLTSLVLAFERFFMRTSNEDRSMIWDSTVTGLGLSRVEHSTGVSAGQSLRAAVGADGVIHLASRTSDFGLHYERIDPAGGTAEFTPRLANGDAVTVTEVLDLIVDSTDQNAQRVYVLFYNAYEAQFFLADLTDPLVNTARMIFDACSLGVQQDACLQVEVAGGLARRDGKFHVAFHHPLTRTLHYGTAIGNAAFTFNQVDGRLRAGRDVHLVNTADSLRAVYAFVEVEGGPNFNQPGQSRIVDLRVAPTVGSPTMLSAAFRLRDGLGRGILDAKPGSKLNEVLVSWQGQKLSPTDNYFIQWGLYTSPGLLNFSVFTGPEELVAPELVQMGDERPLIIAGTQRGGRDFLYRFIDSDTIPSDFPLDGGHIVGEYESRAGKPSLAAVLDGRGRPRLFADDEPHGVTEFIADFIRDGSQEESRKIGEPPPGVRRARLTTGLMDSDGRVHALTQDDAYNLYYRPDVGDEVHLDGPGPNPAPGVRSKVAPGISLAARPVANGPDEVYALWTATNGLNELNQGVPTTGLYIRRVAPSLGRPITVKATTGYYTSYVRGVRSEVRLLIDDGGTLHTAYFDPSDEAIVVWKLANPENNGSIPAVVREVLVPYSDLWYSVSGSVSLLPVLDANGGVHVILGSRFAIYDMDLSGVGAPVFSEWAVAPGEFLSVHDVVLGADSNLHVAYSVGLELYFGAFGKAPRVISQRFNAGLDTIDLVRGDDVEIQLFLSETRFLPDASVSKTIYTQRHVEGAAVTAVPIETFAEVAEYALFGLAVTAGDRGDFHMVYGNPVSGETRYRLLRPSRIPEVQHRRVDGSDPIGLPGDRDADGDDDDSDNCPEVWNPLQLDTNGNDVGDSCELCLAAPLPLDDCTVIASLNERASLVDDVCRLLGDTTGTGPDSRGLTCQTEAGDGDDAMYGFVAPRAGTWTFEITSAAEGFDTVLYVLNSCDLNQAQELACDDDSAGSLRSLVRVQLLAGQEIFVVVDGLRPDSRGAYTLSISSDAGEPGEGCAGVPVVDAGEVDAADAAPIEDAGIPDAAEPDAGGLCPPPNLNLLASVVGGAYLFAGDTTSGRDDLYGGENCTSGTGGRDLRYAFTAPAAGQWTFEITAGAFDTVLYALDRCDAVDPTPLACNDDGGHFPLSLFQLELEQGQEVFVVVDGFFDDSFGPFTLSISPP